MFYVVVAILWLCQCSQASTDRQREINRIGTLLILAAFVLSHLLFA